MKERPTFIFRAAWGTVCSSSPSPLPSPSGRGSIIAFASAADELLDLRHGGRKVRPLPEGAGRGEGEHAIESCSTDRNVNCALQQLGPHFPFWTFALAFRTAHL